MSKFNINDGEFQRLSVSFVDHLTSVVNSVDGAIACSLMGFDGISVETFQSTKLNSAGIDMPNTWVEYANVLGQLKAQVEVLKTGNVSEISVNTEKIVTIMRMVTPEYFVVLALTPNGNYGKGRYALRIAAPKLAKEL
jgi:predicted regulator of Ras-like GTPase activity (Roadblock/LC7/MglB family)